MKQCLITRLKEEVENNNLDFFSNIKFNIAKRTGNNGLVFVTAEHPESFELTGLDGSLLYPESHVLSESCMLDSMVFYHDSLLGDGYVIWMNNSSTENGGALLIDKFGLTGVKTEGSLNSNDSCLLRQFSDISSLEFLNLQCTITGNGWSDLVNTPNLTTIQCYYSTFTDDLEVFGKFPLLSTLQLGQSNSSINPLLDKLAETKESGDTLKFSFNRGWAKYGETYLAGGTIHTFTFDGNGGYSKT